MKRFGSCIQESVIDFHVTMKLGGGVKTTEGVTMNWGEGLKQQSIPNTKIKKQNNKSKSKCGAQ